MFHQLWLNVVALKLLKRTKTGEVTDEFFMRKQMKMPLRRGRSLRRRHLWKTRGPRFNLNWTASTCVQGFHSGWHGNQLSATYGGNYWRSITATEPCLLLLRVSGLKIKLCTLANVGSFTFFTVINGTSVWLSKIAFIPVITVKNTLRHRVVATFKVPFIVTLYNLWPLPVSARAHLSGATCSVQLKRHLKQLETHWRYCKIKRNSTWWNKASRPMHKTWLLRKEMS